MAHKLNDKIRIAYLVSQFPAISHTFILREIQVLRQKGFQLYVASINEPHAIDEDEEGRQTFYVKRQGVGAAFSALWKALLENPFRTASGFFYALWLGGLDLKRILWGVFYYGEALIVGRWMRRNDLTHLHIHFANPASTVGLLVKKVFGIPFSLAVHGPDEFFEVAANALPEKIEEAASIHCISYFTKSQLMRISSRSQWDKMSVSYLGVDTELFSARPFRNEPAPYEILCVGRLVKNKGQYVLLDAIAELCNSGRSLRLRLVGEGPEKEALKIYAQELGIDKHVVFEGAFGQEQTRLAYQRADIYVIASFAEGLPVTLMEAMASQLPCVSTYIAGIPELIRHQVDGLLVPAGDSHALSHALARLMDDSTFRYEVSLAARKRVSEKFNLDKNVSMLFNSVGDSP